MVSVVVAAAVPLGVTEAGEKLQDASAGRPEQVKVTVALKPLIGVTERVAVPLCPGPTLRLVGLEARVKLGLRTTWVVASAVDLGLSTLPALSVAML
jgi:hypothetical protein